MSYYIGIDLGTTNSAICSYDGKETRIWKSPEQNDVTPSAISYDRRGNRLVGQRAYQAAAANPDNAAVFFKRLTGTSTPIHIKALGKDMTPEECSAEILRTLFGYLPEEIRKDPETGTVITVPAAFNQMQRDATTQAANMAGIGRVALMQEPVAAVMSVMKAHNSDGTFLIYDLGGGTLDIAIAESIGGRVNLLSHGGIALCGGRDFDRRVMDSVVKPWLIENFELSEDFAINTKYKRLMRMAALAAERAKIELSAKDTATINLSEAETGCLDENGDEIYLDCDLTRDTFNQLIADRVEQSIQAARDALEKAGLSPFDLERIVFVGGPTNYKPIRDKVCQELGVEGSTEVNPMTAVAEGASLFAESIDWSSKDNSRKTSRGRLEAGGELNLTLNYIARTPSATAKVMVQSKDEIPAGYEFQIDSTDTGWTSGRIQLTAGASVTLTLPKPGLNLFRVSAFDASGSPVKLLQNSIIITRTAATVDAIPASYSIAVEVLDRLGGEPALDYLIRAGEPLPKKGKKIFKAAQTLKAGSDETLNIKLWEGEIENPITDNRPIGVLKISGTDFSSGVIPAGADLECAYEIEDSGNINLEVSVPSIGGVFNSGRNFYSRQEGAINYTDAAELVSSKADDTIARVHKIREVVNDPELDEIASKLSSASKLNPATAQAEETQEAMENVLEARKRLAAIRKAHERDIRQSELDEAVKSFRDYPLKYATPDERQAFEYQRQAAQRAIDRNEPGFKANLARIHQSAFAILWRSDPDFVVNMFKNFASEPYRYADKVTYHRLVSQGMTCISQNDIDGLRQVVGQLFRIYAWDDGGEENIASMANILRG